MSYTSTPALSLKKDNADEPIINLRTHNNDNLDTIDTTVGNLVKAINNAKALLGQLGYDQNGQPVVNASTARANLDAAQSENAAGSLYDAEQAIGTNASAIASLQDSVDKHAYKFSTETTVGRFRVQSDGTAYGLRFISDTFDRQLLISDSGVIEWRNRTNGANQVIWSK